MLSDFQTVGYQFLLDISIYFAHRCAMNIPMYQQKGIRLGCSTCNKFSNTPHMGQTVWPTDDDWFWIQNVVCWETVQTWPPVVYTQWYSALDS